MFHMEQNISFEILNILLNEEMHTRALAKRLNINHMTTLRHLKGLINDNVLDFRMEGRNKIYFLKKNIESRNYATMTELYKLNRVLEEYPVLRKIIKAIQRNSMISLAVLFGSYAKGTVREKSDIDVFIETEDRKLKQELEILNSRLSVKIGEFDRSSPLITEIEKNHIIIKGAENFYEKIEFFN